MKTKTTIAALAITAAAIGLTGCAASAAGKVGDGQLVSRAVTTSDGRDVECIFWVPVNNTGVASAEGAQMDCDWEGAAR